MFDNQPVSIDISNAIIHYSEKILSIFGKDSVNKEFQKRLKNQITKSYQLSYLVQCVGMPNPVPIDLIYQQTKLSNYSTDYRQFDIDLIIQERINSVITGAPGSGKTTLMRWVFIKNFQTNINPVLFTLRYDSDFEFLISFIQKLNHDSYRQHSFLLLIDGYDEISEDKRKELSQQLLLLNGNSVHQFLLSCRTFYSVFDLAIPKYTILDFDDDDIESFTKSFLSLNGFKKSSSEFVSELKKRNFADFISKPLMLTLACVIKTTHISSLPYHTIGLIKRALDTLTFRWDESKGISRLTQTPISGDERIEILKYLAYYTGIQTTEQIALSKTDEYLSLFQKEAINSAKLLLEIAQWYGIYVPIDDTKWTFVHRTIFDYLYARLWVETGSFRPSHIFNFDEKAAYASCMIPNATTVIKTSLVKSQDLNFLVTVLENGAKFDPKEIADSIIKAFENRNLFNADKKNKKISIYTEYDFFAFASTSLLLNLVIKSCNQNNDSKIGCYYFSLHELLLRNQMKVLKAKFKKLNSSKRIFVIRTGNKSPVEIATKDLEDIFC